MTCRPAGRYFYPRSPCGERRVTVLGIQHRVGISIHALLAESDRNNHNFGETALQFLSTLSLRRATMSKRLIEFGKFNFYPRSPCGERPAFVFMAASPLLISIHALLAESDPPRTCLQFWTFYFYPRSPCGERPTRQTYQPNGRRISIHALLAESDRYYHFG